MNNRLTADQSILGGKPIIRGTRISVQFILELLASGAKPEDILKDYPHLTREDIQACLEYAAKSLKNEAYLDVERAG